MILDPEHHLGRGLAVEQDVDGAAKSDILGALADVETDFGFPAPGFPGVDLKHRIFELNPRQVAEQWPPPIHVEFQKAVGDLTGREEVLRLGPLGIGRPVQDGLGVGALCFEQGGDHGLVVNLDEEALPAVLHQDRLGGTAQDLHPSLRIDHHHGQAIGIQDLLDASSRLRAGRFIPQRLQSAGILRRESAPQEGQRVIQPERLGQQRLGFDVSDLWEIVGSRPLPAAGVRPQGG